MGVGKLSHFIELCVIQPTIQRKAHPVDDGYGFVDDRIHQQARALAYVSDLRILMPTAGEPDTSKPQPEVSICCSSNDSTAAPQGEIDYPNITSQARAVPKPPLALIAAWPRTNSVSPRERCSSAPGPIHRMTFRIDGGHDVVPACNQSQFRH